MTPEAALREALRGLPRHTTPDGEETYIEWAAVRDLIEDAPSQSFMDDVARDDLRLWWESLTYEDKWEAFLIEKSNADAVTGSRDEFWMDENGTHWRRPATPSPALDVAYRERNALVAALIRSHGWPAQVVMAPDTEGWWIVYAETPQGQVSWHIGPDDMDLFSDWPVAFGTHKSPWDGHSTEEKYRRLAALAATPSPEPWWHPAESDQPMTCGRCDTVIPNGAPATYVLVHADKCATPSPALDVDRLAEAMASCDGVNWPKRWITNESHDFSWVARQVAAEYAALSESDRGR